MTGPGKAEYAAWLRAEREHRGWTRPQMARRLIDAGRLHGNRTIPSLDSMIHNLGRWERGAWPGEPSRLLIRAVLGLPPPPPVLTPATGQPAPIPVPVSASGVGQPSALTLTITIQLPPGATADITPS